MKLLAADTSTSLLSLAVCEGTHVLAEYCGECGRRHSERMLEATEFLLDQAGLRFADIDCLAVTIGPGSFTGLRIGVSTWKGLAQGLSLPLVTVPTLDALVRSHGFSDGPVCAALDAKMNEVFGAWFEFESGPPMRLGGDQVCSMEALLADAPARPVFIGDGAVRYSDVIREALPDARILPASFGVRGAGIAQAAAERLEAGAETDPAAASPVYLRLSQAETNPPARPAAAEH